MGASTAYERAQRQCATALSCPSRRKHNTVSAFAACSGTAACRCPFEWPCIVFIMFTDSSLPFTKSAPLADSHSQPVVLYKSGYIATAGLLHPC